MIIGPKAQFTQTIFGFNLNCIFCIKNLSNFLAVSGAWNKPFMAFSVDWNMVIIPFWSLRGPFNDKIWLTNTARSVRQKGSTGQHAARLSGEFRIIFLLYVCRMETSVWTRKKFDFSQTLNPFQLQPLSCYWLHLLNSFTRLCHILNA